MVSTRNVPAVRLVGLAVVLVLSGLAPAMPQAEAQSTVPLVVLSGPYYTFNVPATCQGKAAILARPAGNETQVQTVQVQSQGSTSLSQIMFVYDVVADPGTATKPGMSKALTWIAAQSGGAGWTATVSHGNEAASGYLNFTGPNPGVNIPVGSVVKSANGIEFETIQAGALQPAEGAQGTVTFTRSASASGIPSVPHGTIVRTSSGIEFRTIADVQLTGPSADVQVIAEVGGASGNVGVNTVTVMGSTIDGVQSVTNNQAMRGGRDPHARLAAQAVEPGLEGNVPANILRLFVNPITGVANVTNDAAMSGGTALKAGDRRVLTFTAQAGSQLSSGPGAIFTFAFRVPRTAQGDANGATPDSFPIAIKTSSPAGATDETFCIRMDNTPPKLLTSVTRDSDKDGRIDLMELTFSEALAKDSLVHSQFKVQVRGAPRPYFVLGTSPELEASPCNFNPENTVEVAKIMLLTPDGPLGSSSLPCPRRVILKMAPGPTFDTGDRPDVTYPASGEGTLTDLAGNKLATINVGNVNTTDGSKPVMVSALAKDGSNKIVVTFSEPVQGSGAPTTIGGQTLKPVYMDAPECSTGQCRSDFTYRDGCYPVPIPAPNPPCPAYTVDATGSNVGSGDCFDEKSNVGMPKQVAGLTHTPAGPTANQVILNAGTGSIQFPGRYSKAWGDPNSAGWSQPPQGTNGCTNGKLGAGDTHKVFGDLLGLQTDQKEKCTDTTKKIYDFEPCLTVIKDHAGLHAVAYKSAGELIVTGVYITEAEVNIDSFRLTLKFNGPVSSAAGDTIGIQLSDLDVVSADDTGQGPAGILSINHTAGSDQAILTLDHRTRPTDVDDTPARIRVSCAAGHGIKAFGFQGVFVPCNDPDADNKADVGMVDRTPPSFTPPAANIPMMSTIDADRNGYIDGIKVYFSEPIDDSSFCMGPTTLQDPLPPVRCMGDGFVDAKCDHPSTHSILIVDNIPGPYTFDTDLLPDDKQGIIRFPETPGRLQTTGFTPAITTNACWSSDPSPNNYRTDNYAPGNPTHFMGQRRGTGLFADQYHPQPSNPPYLVANYMKRVCGEQFGGGTQQNIPLCIPGASDQAVGGGITVKVADGAPPVLWHAKTFDTPFTTQFCGGSQSAGCEGDGFIDAYQLEFSEPINDCSFRPSEWKVAGRNVTGYRTNLKLTSYNAICNPAPKYPPQGQGDNVTVLTFERGANPDTDAKPELTYTGQGTCNSCGLRDLNGNPMAAFGALAITEKDNAPPVIYCARGFVGRQDITVEFSEPVDNGDRGKVTRSDFIYANGNPLDFKGASGMSGTTEVQHSPGGKVATITMNEPLSSGDILNDTIAADVHAIVEVAPTVAVKKPVSTLPHKYCRGVDVVPPGPVQNLQVVSGLTSANSVTLSWTAPGSDGNELGNVTGYRLKVSTSIVTPADFNFTTGGGVVTLLETTHERDPATCRYANGTAIPDCEPQCKSELSKATAAVKSGQVILRMMPTPCELAWPGNVQRATFVGLEQDTTYHFAVMAFDNATDKDGRPRSNFGAMGGEVSATTKKDTTPPSPAPVIFSDIRPYTAQEDDTPTFRWSNATDPESVVQYGYRLTNDPDELDYSIRCDQDQKTLAPQHTPSPLADGLWTFHVAACSPGGSTSTAHYTIIVGAAPIPPERIREANLRVQTLAYRLGDEYIINWTLPSEALLQQSMPGAQLEAVNVVALICIPTNTPPCERRIVHTQLGTYAQLKDGIPGGYHDLKRTADYEVEPYYRAEMVFASGQDGRRRLANGEPDPDDAGSVADFTQPRDITPKENQLTGLILTILVALACAALVTWAILASRKRAALNQLKEEAPAGVDPETGLPTHDVKCPTCTTPFQAVGTLPLQITCPNCGAAGLLQ